MTEAHPDTIRALAAASEVVDGRDLEADMGAILVTLDYVVATVLLTVMDEHPAKAVAMLHEGLVPAVEKRIARYAAHYRGDA